MRITAAIRIVSVHPLLVREVHKILAGVAEFRGGSITSIATETHARDETGSASLYLLDACSLKADLGSLAARLRSHSPGSKFIALLPPSPDTLQEKICLFHWGIDGFVELHEAWHIELPLAIRSVWRGQPWAPPEVLLAFVSQARALLNAQLRNGHFLTSREAEVLQLLMRRQTNKDIAASLAISERTVKFHVSNILSKLQLDDRRSLSPGRLPFKELYSGI
jgi:DNA-binding NarL/FixJ family response regulator